MRLTAIVVEANELWRLIGVSVKWEKILGV